MFLCNSMVVPELFVVAISAKPSLSKSPEASTKGEVPAYDDLVKLPVVMFKAGEWVMVKKGVDAFNEFACSWVDTLRTIIGVTEEAPAGTFTTIEVPGALALAVTFMGPKYTSFGPEALKPVPVIVMVVPTGPEVGEKLVMVCAQSLNGKIAETSSKHRPAFGLRHNFCLINGFIDG